MHSTDATPIPYQSPGFATAPHTPDQGRLLRNQQHPEIHNLSADGGSLGQEKQQQEIASSYVQEMQTNSSNQLLDSVIASSSSPSSLRTPLMKDNGGIDLNKTPQINTPKRKKYRPKVVVEGKPKRTPRPATPSNTQKRTSSGKRKDVRKKCLREDSISQQGNETKTPEFEAVQSTAKSCRRMLNFEFEAAAELQGKDQWKTPSMGLNRRAAEQEQQQGGSTSALLNSASHKSTEKFVSLPTSIAPRDHTLNVIARTINLKNATTHQIQPQNQFGYSKVRQQINGKVMGQMPLHPNADWMIKHDEANQLMLQTRIESINSVLPESNEKRGHKRDYSSIAKLTPSPTNLMPLNESGKSGMGISEIQGKRQFEDKFHGAACNTNVKKSSRQVEYSGSLQSSDLEEKNWPQHQTNGASGFPNYQYKDPTVVGNNIHGQRYPSKVKLQRDCMADQFLKEYTEPYRASLLTQQNMPSPLQRGVHITTQANETTTQEDHKPVKRRMVEHKSSTTPLNKETKLPKDFKKETNEISTHLQTIDVEASPLFGAGTNEKWDHAMEIEEITCQLKQLQISHSGQTEVRGEKETALVSYKGDDETNVPCEVDPIRRRKPRLKVDLDPETKKLWLIRTNGSESTETTSKEEEYWKKERDVFHGRVSSFISQLSLLQGLKISKIFCLLKLYNSTVAKNFKT